MDKIPIVVGVSGHRDLQDQDIPKLEEIVRDELKNLMNSYPHSPFSMLSSLAEGADQLCAKIAIELGIDLICILPQDLDDFKRDFEGDALSKFEKYLSYAEDYFVAPNTESIATLNSLKGSLSDEDFYRKIRHFGYRQAGIYVSKHSHVLLALNEGKTPSDDGCGTAEAIDFVLNQNYEDVQDPYFKTANYGSVIEIRTPRVKNPNVEYPFKVSILPNKNKLENILKRTDDFNKDY